MPKFFAAAEPGRGPAYAALIDQPSYANGDANYLQMPAQQALEAFSADPDVTSPDSG